MENRTTISCGICLGDPNLPVAVQCGHIFCWSCLRKWFDKQPMLQCPMCRNGIEQDKIIKLFTDKETKSDEVDDRPQPKKVEPQKNANRPRFFRRILTNFGVDEFPKLTASLFDFFYLYLLRHDRNV